MNNNNFLETCTKILKGTEAPTFLNKNKENRHKLIILLKIGRN